MGKEIKMLNKSVQFEVAKEIIDRRFWVMYLIRDFGKIDIGKIKINPEVVAFAAEHVRSFMSEGVEPPEAIATTIYNLADDIKSGQRVTIRSGDYIALQNYMRNTK